MSATTRQFPVAYRPVAILLHWVVALLVISIFPAGVAMLGEDLPRRTQDLLFIFHKNVGVLIFVLVVLRLVYRALNPAPPLPASVPALQRRIAAATHWLLYLLLLVMTVTGYVYTKAGGFPVESLDAMGIPSLVPESEPLAEAALAVHTTVRFALFLLVIIHIGAALYHAIIRRDGVFTRMAPFLRRR